MKIRLAVFLAVLALPGGLVAGACLTPEEANARNDDDPPETGFTVSIQSDQGQGSIDCSAFTGPGGEMFQIKVEQDQARGSVSDPIFWSVPPGAEPEPGADPLVHVDILFIGSSDGARCTQHLSGNARSGLAAAGTKRKFATLIACSDGKAESVIPAPVAPVSSSDGSCNVDADDIALQDAINKNGKYDVVIAIGRGDKGDNTAICADTTADPAGTGTQGRCTDVCVTPDPLTTTVGYDPTCDIELLSSPFPIRCRACELNDVIDSDPFSDANPQYCWEKLQQVDKSFESSEDWTFRKAPGPKGNQVWKVDEYAGSTCYKISGTTDSGYRYAYFVPSGCTRK
jgi:hypothetical protein